MPLRSSQCKDRGQRGYVLLAILFALTVLIVALAAAAPRATTAIRRTQENELVRRGEQYALAIRRFYKKFGRYPSNVDQLENTNNIRFLRRRYLDPLTGKDDWKLIQFGQARPAVGFFGQKLVNTSGPSPAGAGLGPSTIGSGLGGPSNPASSGTATSASPSGATGTNAGAGAGTSAGGTSTGPAQVQFGTASTPLSGDQLTGRTFGGGAIVGVSVPSDKESLKEFQQKNHYNEWQFVYDPTMDPTLRGGASAGSATGIPGASGQNPGGFGRGMPTNQNIPSSGLPPSPSTPK